ncbi:glycosyltransferase 87 family protein [Kineosporia sp. A_224]|uniref:glycosyltransferase 87 family protein n=1 Tax=Kineosporia sp. A_224 TaxID=1962180 RepID=UPI000B4A89BB|nr:glycosyltransferase 87 family protein [Kineosporia sp. A_224]
MPLLTRTEPAAPAREPSTGSMHAVVAVVVLGAVTAAMTHSVVRYRLWIVAVYVAAAVLLAVRLGRDGAPVRLTRATGALALAVCGVVTAGVRGYSYVPPDAAVGVRVAMAGTAFVAAGVLLVPWRRAADAALLVAALGHTAVVAALVRLDPAPRIDVWYTLQGFADALGSGHNAYSEVWVGPPGIMRAFTYLPWTGALVSPGRWLLGDVRWALLAAMLLAALALRAASRTPVADAATSAAGPVAGAVLLVLPGTATQAEQAWTEPLLLACLAGAAVALLRRRTWLAVLLVGLALASKQHIAVLLPVLALWHRFGLRRTVLAGLVAAGLVAPWFLTAPADMWHDTVTYLVTFPALKFSNTLYLAAVNDLGWSPPFWLTGLVVVGTVAAVALTVRRRRPGVAELLRWCALVLAAANLVNKQAFYNQYWLVVALVVLSWALPQDDAADDPAGDPADDETTRQPATGSPASSP